MAILPYRNLVVGKRLKEKIFHSNRIIAPDRLGYLIPDVIEVIMQGPECKEKLVGKLVLLPTYGGTEIVLEDLETQQPESFVVIHESDLLAIVDEELASA